jgi:hypothetical protein
VVDRTRHIADHLGWSSILAATRAMAEGAHLDPWRGRAPLLVVESESLAGLFEPLAARYRIVLVSVRGQAGGAYLVNDVRPYVERGHTEVLYVGDFDKAGGDIEDSARERLETHSGRRLRWSRLALTAEQVEAHDLPLIERYDHRDGQTREVCECEAMPQAILLDLVETAVRDRLPAPLQAVHAPVGSTYATISTWSGRSSGPGDSDGGSRFGGSPRRRASVTSRFPGSSRTT